MNIQDNRTSGSPHSNFTLTAAFILVGSAGVGIFLCMPVVGPSLIDSFGFNAQQVGEFSFVQLAFISLGCLLGMFSARYFRMRAIAIVSIGGLLLMDLVSPHLESYSLFLVARGIAGIAGGAAMALATGALAQLPGVERNFGMFLLVQILLSMISIWAIPQLVAAIGIKGVFYPLVGLDILVLLLCFSFIPSIPFADVKQDQSPNSRMAWLCSSATLLAMLSFFTAIGCYWTYVGLIGSSSGLTAEAVGRGLSIATIGGILGSLVPAILRQRLGGLFPLIVSAGLLLGALYFMSAQASLAGFSIAAAAFLFGWYVFHPYQLGILASVDSDGRPTMASAALTGLGLGLGPALVSRYVEENISVVYVVSAAGFMLALVLLVGVALFTPKVVSNRDQLEGAVADAP